MKVPKNYKQRYFYNSNGDIVKKIMLSGCIVTYEYDDKRRLIKTTYSCGDEYTYYYSTDEIGDYVSKVTLTINNEPYYCIEYDRKGHILQCTLDDGIPFKLLP